jgi:hypothetical protein
MMDGRGEIDDREHEDDQRSIRVGQHNDDLEESKDDMRNFKENINNRSFKDDQYNDAISVKSRLPKNAEELVVPAHGLKKPIDFNLVGEDDFNGGGNATND